MQRSAGRPAAGDPSFGHRPVHAAPHSWRLVDLVQWIWEEFRIVVSETTMGRVVNEMGYRKLSARPRHHAQNPDAMDVFKKTSPPPWRTSRTAKQPAKR